MESMSITTARTVIGLQNQRIKSLHGLRFKHKGYEYEVRYEGGFATFVSLYRREIGKRNFKWFNGEGCYDCWTAKQAWEKLTKKLP